MLFVFFFFKQKTAYEMRISDWSSDVCSSDLNCVLRCERATSICVSDATIAANSETSTAAPAIHTLLMNSAFCSASCTIFCMVAKSCGFTNLLLKTWQSTIVSRFRSEESRVGERVCLYV